MLQSPRNSLPPEGPIRSLFWACVELFKEFFHCLQSSNPGEEFADRLQNEASRFRVWAENSGAHRTGRVSLDKRLHEASKVKHMVLELLEALEKALQKGIAIVSNRGEDEVEDMESWSSDSSASSLERAGSKAKSKTRAKPMSPLEKCLIDITHVITCLYDFSIAIRNPAPKDQLQKCASIDVSHFEDWDVQHVSHKFQFAEDYLKTRLGMANTRRRQLLIYYMEHQSRIAGHSEILLSGAIPADGKTKADNSISNHDGHDRIATKSESHDNHLEMRSKTIVSGPSAIQTQTTVSTYVPQAWDPKIMDIDTCSEANQTCTSYASSAPVRHHLSVPDPPNNDYGEPFECNYCFSIIRINGRESWKRHVFKDLRPYVCTFSKCPRANHLFESRRDWFQHEVELHRREWFCKACQVTSPSPKVFEEHLREKHCGLVSNDELPTLIARCERPIKSTQLCHLCKEEVKPNVLQRHLGAHLQQIALFVLPCSMSDDDDLGSKAAHANDEDTNSWSNSELEFNSIGTVNSEQARYLDPNALFVPEEIRLELELEAEDRRNGLSTLETYKSQEDGVFSLFNNETCVQKDFPCPPVSARIKTSLLSHQQEALSFMMRQELSVDSPHSLPVLWEEVENRGETRFRHRITGGYSPERPKTTRGGIIADEMGMGKTLTTLAFIATSMDEEENSNVECERSVAQVRATLIITPAAAIVSWKEQITRHTEDLTVLYYSGQSDSDKNAANFDIVIATYTMVMLASKTSKRAECGKGFFQRVQWRRIVLDEAHVIRNRNAKQTQAICSLEAESRWCLTGAPIQNCLDDFGALLQFLRFAPLDQKSIFSKNVILPLKKGTPDGLKNLKMIIAATTLRRTKKSLEDLSDDLPPRIDIVQRLNMSEEEQRLHTLISDEAKRALDQAIKNGQEGHFSGFIMQSLLRIRQLCNGIALLPEDFRLDLFGNATRSDCTNLSSSSAGVCESCQSKLDTTTSKLFEGCYHFLCSRCSRKNEASGPTSELCPTCSDRTLNDVGTDIQPSTPDTSMLNNSKNVSVEHPSSKIQGLIKNLRLEPGAKSVVFACWVSMLNLISLELDRQGIGYTRLDGSMTMERRVQSIKSFREDENKTVMLATIGSSGVGIDLTVATYVHLMEPQYNPMMEEQALARVHRIGQKKQVTTIRYIMKDSYEQSIMGLQAQKLRLADMCTGTGTGTRQNLLRLRACLR
ncbi:hypothetical protein K440DRAFT_585247 [Wilcoxina mikolae CBS 423.85]|nr:hypothetical protein K440DRAFT_585247 [Wilcoxina mikolae CBS 423.85]